MTIRSRHDWDSPRQLLARFDPSCARDVELARDVLRRLTVEGLLPEHLAPTDDEAAVVVERLLALAVGRSRVCRLDVVA